MTHEKLRDYTMSELAAMKEQTKARQQREERACAWCDKVKVMRADQRFCGASCRVAYSQAAARIQYERVLRERDAWQLERQALIREIADLKRQLGD